MRKASKVITVLVFIFLYFPIIILAVASFSSGTDIAVFKEFTVKTGPEFRHHCNCLHDRCNGPWNSRRRRDPPYGQKNARSGHGYDQYPYHKPGYRNWCFLSINVCIRWNDSQIKRNPWFLDFADRTRHIQSSLCDPECNASDRTNGSKSDRCGNGSGLYTCKSILQSYSA